LTQSIRIQAVDRDGHLHQLTAPIGAVLMEVLRDANLGIEAVCGGCCSCATCHVFFPEAACGQPGEVEAALLQATDNFQQDRSRLSCQIELQQELDNLRVQIAPEG